MKRYTATITALQLASLVKDLPAGAVFEKGKVTEGGVVLTFADPTQEDSSGLNYPLAVRDFNEPEMIIIQQSTGPRNAAAPRILTSAASDEMNEVQIRQQNAKAKPMTPAEANEWARNQRLRAEQLAADSMRNGGKLVTGGNLNGQSPTTGALEPMPEVPFVPKQATKIELQRRVA